jgi:hypothetical protein
MAKEIVCSSCKKANLIVLVHDEQMNLICDHCKFPIFGTTEKAEAQIKASFPEVSSYHYSKKEAIPIKL